MTKKQLFLSWLAGALLIAGVFYIAVAWLWSAVSESRASSVEAQVISALSNDLAEGNLFKLGVTLAKIKRDGLIRFAEIRQVSDSGASNLVYRTQGDAEPTDEIFKAFHCGEHRRLVSRSLNGVSLITTLPSSSIGMACSILYISSDLPPDLQRFKIRLTTSFGGLLVALFGVFFWFTMSWYRRILKLETANILMRVEKEAEIGRLAAQVAHDIRSPLAALGSAAKDLVLPEAQRKLMEGAVGRMQGIADDLLQRYRAPSAIPAKSKPVVCTLGGLVEQVLAEKRLQHKEKTGVKIEFAGASEEIKALVEPKELQRLISNLVNNSIEAFDGPGTVFVSLSAPDGGVLIEVKDKGKGIPPEILAKLGRKGETHGKAGGNGLGLYHARTAIEGWGGSFTMKSEPGQGTAVLITLPRAATQPAGRMAVLLDDDPLVHMNWKLAAKAAGIELKAFKIPDDFTVGIETLSKDAPIYIDSELGDGIKGENIAKELHDKGFINLTMATGRGPEKFAYLPWLKVTGKEPPWA